MRYIKNGIFDLDLTKDKITVAQVKRYGFHFENWGENRFSLRLPFIQPNPWILHAYRDGDRSHYLVKEQFSINFFKFYFCFWFHRSFTRKAK